MLACWPTDRISINELHGEFAVVLHDAATRNTTALRDALGVHPLYYRLMPGGIAFASRADVLASGDDDYDMSYLSAFLAGCAHDADASAFASVFSVPAGHFVRFSDDRLTVHRWWSAEQFVDAVPRPVNEAVAEFRGRFARAVRSRIAPDAGATWSELSGGLDSSSVVSMASQLAHNGLAPHALGGTVTLVDRHGTGGDERRFVDAVTAAHRVPNTQLFDDARADDDDDPPPLTDQPTASYLAYPRDRRLARAVRRGGGSVLLSGYGSDHYLGGSAIFLADLAARGRLGAAIREATRWAVVGRVSAWSMLWHNVAVPMMPGALVRRVLGASRVPPWIRPTVVRALNLDAHGLVTLAAGGPIGRKYISDVLRALDGMPDVLALHAVIQDTVEERHPFLDRALVELSLGFPPEICAQPCARKWVLREAMRGL
ncbi:MAG TPA: asparagine synthase-related protein, partial [Gemmatimonadaceae bacterium]|nr:asparagine synthase-related protein [Gemmatimonadaceae bacterium]